MTTFNDFKKDLYNMIEKAIIDGVSYNVIVDAIINTFGTTRKNALTMVACVGAQLNIKHNPGMMPEDALRIFIGE